MKLRYYSMNFCPECDNIFNYEEDTSVKKLTYYCKKCNIEKPLENYCLTTKTFKQKRIPFINYNDAVFDKTLPVRQSETCTKCKTVGMSFIRNEDLSVIYVCRNTECKNVVHTQKSNFV